MDIEHFKTQLVFTYTNCSMGTHYLHELFETDTSTWMARDIALDTCMRALENGEGPTDEDVKEWLEFLNETKSIEYSFVRWYMEKKVVPLVNI